jgi:hypothetical protein
MKIPATLCLCSTMLALPLAAFATPGAPQAAHRSAGSEVEPQVAPPKSVMLRNLDDEMDRTGRVARPALTGAAEVPLAQTGMARETKVDSISVASPTKAPVWRLLRDDPTLDVQYGEAFVASVAACRFIVARELGVSPVDVEAGVVTFRWTIEPSGGVRDGVAIADSPTNEAVTACARRVVFGRVLLNPVAKPLPLEWTYSFHKIAARVPLATQDLSK